MQDGMTAENAMILSNPIRQPKIVKGGHEDDGSNTNQTVDRLTRDKLKNLKHDIDTLSNVRELREKDAERIQGKAHVLKQHAHERKVARRAIHRITEQERAADRALEEKEEQWKKEEQARLEGYHTVAVAAGTSDNPPQPSLLSLVMFLKEKIQMLPDAICPCCREPALPSDPKVLESLYLVGKGCSTTTSGGGGDTGVQQDKRKKEERKRAKAMRPMRCYCGCWYHYKCLDQFMREPPFGASCPTAGCGRRVFHPDWPDDIKQLERAWASHQARLREIQDAAMFL